VNDLHLFFFGGDVKQVTDKTGKIAADKISGSEWYFPSTGPAVQNNDKFPVKYDEGDNRVLIDRTSSFWTLNGRRPFVSDISMLGLPPDIRFAINPATGHWTATAFFTNRESRPITYTNITAYLLYTLAGDVKRLFLGRDQARQWLDRLAMVSKSATRP
jgi:hypothetical protein